MMRLVLFEDARWRGLRPLTDPLPVPALAFGVSDLARRWLARTRAPLFAIEARRLPLAAWHAAPVPDTSPVAVSAPPRPAGPDTCWHVQVGAPTERARGRQLLAASQSQLLVPMEVVHDHARYKVRSKQCLSRTAAESLRHRAVASGFKGVFLVPTAEPRR